MTRHPLAALTLLAALCVCLLTVLPSGAFPTSGAVYTTYQDATCAYTVRSGDWLSRIAASHHTTWQTLASVNHLSNPNLLFPGQRLAVCADSSPPGNTLSYTAQGMVRAIYHPQRYRDTGAPGSCVWYAQHMRPDLYLSGAGAAANIPAIARMRGYHVGYLPAVGALVVMQRGVRFAYAPGPQWANGQYGHTAYVTAVYSDGSYQMASMASPALWVVTYWVGRPGPGISYVYG